MMLNNAGFGGVKGPFHQTDMGAAYEATIAVNLTGAILGMKHAAAVMLPQASGSIINTSSVGGIIGGLGSTIYSACKAGIIALNKSVARETGRYGIRLNVVCPGLVVPPREESISEESMWNEMREIFTDEVKERVERNYLFRRLAKASEIANAVVFLASDAASFITGQTLSVSGGYTMM